MSPIQFYLNFLMSRIKKKKEERIRDMGLNKEESSHTSSSLAPILFLEHFFHTLSLTLLALLLPLSFLLLARLAHSPIPSPLAALLRFLVSVLSASSLLYSLSGRLLAPRLAIAWPFLFAFQLCVSLGIELIIAEGVTPTRTTRAPWILRAVFFLGLYETMLHWSRSFVRPVVDDTVFGVRTDDGRVIGRAAVGVAFSVLWLRMLRDDVEPLLSAAGREGLVAAASGWDAFALWFVSYTTVVIGVVRVVEVAYGIRKLTCLFLCCGAVDDADLSFVPGGDEV